MLTESPCGAQTGSAFLDQFFPLEPLYRCANAVGCIYHHVKALLFQRGGVFKLRRALHAPGGEQLEFAALYGICLLLKNFSIYLRLRL